MIRCGGPDYSVCPNIDHPSCNSWAFATAVACRLLNIDPNNVEVRYGPEQSVVNELEGKIWDAKFAKEVSCPPIPKMLNVDSSNEMGCPLMLPNPRLCKEI